MRFARGVFSAVLAASATVGVALASPSVAAVRTGEIHGHVTRSATGGAVTDAEVTVFDAVLGELVAITDAGRNGRYAVAGLPAGRGYFVCFAPPEQLANFLAPQCWLDAPWQDNGSPAENSSIAQVRSGQVTSGINAALHPIGSLSGQVTLLDSQSYTSDMLVHVFSVATGDEVAQVFPDGVGAFEVHDLMPGGYDVCVDSRAAQLSMSPSYPYGIESGCVGDPVWTFEDRTADRPAAGARAVTVRSGATVRARFTLEPAAAIGGALRTASGASVSDVVVVGVDSEGRGVPAVHRQQSGTYTLPGLDPGAAYTVCFDASSATGASSLYSLQSQCFDRIPWVAGQLIPDGTTLVTTDGSGTVHTGVDAALVERGGIGGTVLSSTGDPVRNVPVRVFDSSGLRVATSLTGGTGRYRVRELDPDPAGYTVCFAPVGSYGGQCYDGVPWAGDGTPVPDGTKPVVVRPGRTHGGVDAALTTSNPTADPLRSRTRRVATQVVRRDA